MKKFLLLSWPFLIIFLAVAVFFYPLWVKGQVALPGDFIVGVYYPWLDYQWGGYGAGVPVKNPITADVVSFIYPMQIAAVTALKSGVIPLWNNYILAGTPLMANFQSAPFSPTNFLYFIFSSLTAWNLQIFLQPFLGALFLFFLLREFGRSKLASVFGGLAFSFAGFMTIWLEWNGHSLVAAFFPLIILLVVKWLKKPQLGWGVLLSISLAAQIFAGYPQIILYEAAALVLLILIFDRKFFLNFKSFTGLAFFVALGLGLSAIQLLPGYEMLTLSQRKVESVLNVGAFLPWQLIITFLAPDYFGSHVTGNYWGPGDYTLTTGFSGVVVITLAMIGLLNFFKQKEVKFALGLILFSLAIALPNPITVAIKNSGFLGLQAASAHRILVLTNLGFAILAAFGLDALVEHKLTVKKVLSALILPAGVILIFLFGTVILIFLNKKGGQFFKVTDLQVGLKNLLLPFTHLAVVTVILLMVVRFKKYNSYLKVVLVLLSLTELFRFGWKFTPFSPREFVFPKTGVINFLQSQPKPFRVVGEDVVPINFMMAYGIETVEGYDAVYPLRTAQYLATLNSGQVDATPMGRYGSVSNVNSPLLNLANGKYILALKRDKNGKVDKNGQLPEKFNRFQSVFEDKTVAVLENKQVLARAFLVYDWQRMDPPQILAALAQNYPVKNQVLLEKNPPFVEKGGQGQATVLKDDNKKLITTESNKSGLLVIADSWFPGWKAFVNGQEKPVLKADYNFMAVPVPAGKSEVRLEFEPVSYRNGKLISQGALILLFATGLFWYIFKRGLKI